MRIDVAVLGASGYGGGELLRRLATHPHARLAIATSRTFAGKPVHASFPGLANRLDAVFAADATVDELSRCQMVFLARDNGVAMKEAPDLLARGCKVIDLSADFRFRDTSVYDAWYKRPHACPELSKEAVYGMPELYRDAIKSARLVGNPGCYTTAAILGLAPLLEPGADLIEPTSIIVDAKSGISGAGRSKFALEFHFSEANECVTAYKIAGTHRHTPEIEAELSAIAQRPIAITFTPHLIPMTRGIATTCYANLTKDMTTEAVREVYRRRFAGETFVHITDGVPSTKHTYGSNMLHIGLGVDRRLRRVTVVACLDNLGKGMAGQAIQNMNLMCGFDETAGIDMPGIWP